LAVTNPKQINDPLSEALAAVGHRGKQVAASACNDWKAQEAVGEPLSASLQRIMEYIDYQTYLGLLRGRAETRFRVFRPDHGL
jgi:hypothetical protein